MDQFSELCELILNSTTSDMASEKLSNMAILTMLVWIVRKNMSYEERAQFITTAVEHMRNKFIRDYESACESVVQDLSLPKPNTFRSNLDMRMNEISDRLRRLLL